MKPHSQTLRLRCRLSRQTTWSPGPADFSRQHYCFDPARLGYLALLARCQNLSVSPQSQVAYWNVLNGLPRLAATYRTLRELKRGTLQDFAICDVAMSSLKATPLRSLAQESRIVSFSCFTRVGDNMKSRRCTPKMKLLHILLQLHECQLVALRARIDARKHKSPCCRNFLPLLIVQAAYLPIVRKLPGFQ